MKKLLALLFLLCFCTTLIAEARTQYDSTGRNIVVDGTIRGQRKARQEQIKQQQKMQQAAAARLNYEEALKSLEERKPTSNYIQDRYNY